MLLQITPNFSKGVALLATPAPVPASAPPITTAKAIGIPQKLTVCFSSAQKSLSLDSVTVFEAGNNTIEVVVDGRPPVAVESRLSQVLRYWFRCKGMKLKRDPM